MRQRINVNAVCSSENYAASKRVHRKAVQAGHSAFENSSLALSLLAIATPSEPSDNTLVWVSVFGKKQRVPYHVAKNAKMTWSYV